ncbi:MAG: SUMF1/EgtB/PvdO family nonheme iron enzyme [Aggregatilineales bacterium]
MMQIPSNFLTRIREILLPLVTDVDERDLLLTEAFYLENPVLYGMEREGNALVFCSRCSKSLLDFGCLKPGEHSLSRLLSVARTLTDVDKHNEIESLVKIANELCGMSPPTPAPVMAPTVMTPPQTLDTPHKERKPTVFISYSHADTEFAKKLIGDLSVAGHACWIDITEIKGGDEWIMTIAEGINNSYAFVPILTLKAINSKWVQDEILWARQKNKLIIPVILENVLGETRFFPLVSYQGVTLFDSDYATMLPRLLSYLPNSALSDVDVSDEIASDESVIETMISTTPRTVPRKLELDYLDRLRFEQLLNTEKYTAMGGTAQVKKHAEMRTQFELIKVGKQDRDGATQATKRFENAVEEISHIRRCVLLGEPGGGKTTTIWKLASDLVETTLNDRTAPIPFLIRLGKWTSAEQPLQDFIVSQLGDLGKYASTLLNEKRAALLLDGLNELPASQHKNKYPQVKAFVEQHPDLLAVVSCRELDYTIDLGVDKINITPLDPLRIREFAGRYLGEEKGDDLFWKLAGESATNQHKSFMDKFGEKLDDPEHIFWIEIQLPEGMSWGYRWNNNTYWQGWLKEREEPSGLMVLARNPYMLLMLTSVYADEGKLPDNRGQLFAKFVETLIEREGVPETEQTPLIEGLAKVAYEMQIRRAEFESDKKTVIKRLAKLDDDRRIEFRLDALTVLPEKDVKTVLGERLLYLAGSASILSIDEQVRFTHQLLQEYFAATYMDLEIKAGRLDAKTIWKPESWWERTNWEEAAILLAGLYSDDPTPVVDWLIDAQPEVAAQCITRSGVNMPPDETLLRFRQLIPRLTDLKSDPEPKARASIGRALGQLLLSNGKPLDNRRGVSFITKNNMRLPDIDWVAIAGGEFQYGHEIERDNPPQVIQLPAFEISRYPVTYAQFQCFVEATDYDDDRWWEGIPEEEAAYGRKYRTRELREQGFKFWNHPRESVAWYQAIAFGRWLSDKLGYTVTLPTEQQWERSARGLDGRFYPYGDEFYMTRGNISQTGIGQTSAVGIFPNGASPDGVLELSGNVYDWCLNKYYSYEETDVDVSGDSRVVRGGSWSRVSSFARAVFRNNGDPNYRSDDLGFRLVRPLRAGI